MDPQDAPRSAHEPAWVLTEDPGPSIFIPGSWWLKYVCWPGPAVPSVPAMDIHGLRCCSCGLNTVGRGLTCFPPVTPCVACFAWSSGFAFRVGMLCIRMCFPLHVCSAFPCTLHVCTLLACPSSPSPITNSWGAAFVAPSVQCMPRGAQHPGSVLHPPCKTPDDDDNDLFGSKSAADFPRSAGAQAPGPVASMASPVLPSRQ